MVNHETIGNGSTFFTFTPFAVLQTLLFNSKIKCKMETVLMIIAVLSLVAFVVGMFNPKTVKCSSRGKVALIYVSVFLITSIIGTSISDGTDSNEVDRKSVV